MQLQIKKARGTFLHLFTAQPSLEEGKDPKFNGNFIIEKDGDASKAIRKAMEAVAIEKWGANGVKVLDNFEASKLCLRDGDRNLDKDGNVRKGFEGMQYIVASSKTKPGLFDNKKDPATDKARALLTDDGTLYSGCYVNLSLDIYAVDNPTQKVKGVFADLRGVQFAGHGERLGGGAPATADEFDCTEEDDDLGF
jgi:hypothetical protein